MIFAAGLGTRLAPLTRRRPKALVEVAGVPMLERVARRLVAAGADRLIINLHPYPDRVRDFVARSGGFGAEVLFSEEADGPLDTGGGLARAARLFRRDAPFFLHNADVVTDLSLRELHARHAASGALATLAVNRRTASRYLLFDDAGLCGHVAVDGRVSMVRDPAGPLERLAFCGVHVASPALLDALPDPATDRPFSIIGTYLDCAAAGESVAPYDVTGALWLDIGTPQRLAEAEVLWKQMSNSGLTEDTIIALDFTHFGKSEEDAAALANQLSENYKVEVIPAQEDGYWYVKGTTRPHGITLTEEQHAGWVEFMADVAQSHSCVFSTWSLESPALSMKFESERVENAS
jgi:N-acetyl-alpha-D-muramate 1-phosphate uridylyltransferase